MSRLTANDFHPEVLRLFDDYVHSRIARDQFISAAAQYTKVGQTGESLLEALRPRFAENRQVQPTDPRIQAGYAIVSSLAGHGWVRCYVVRPTSHQERLPGVLVAHENRGLNPHIEDVARRVALEGYIAFAPDALSTVGGYPGDEDGAREMFKALDAAKVREDFLAAAAHLKSLLDPGCKYGAVGFCWGGGIVNFLATRLPDLAAAAPFYGPAPASEDVPNIKAPLLIHYAENDDKPNARWPAYREALDASDGARYAMYIYPGTQHGFNNDTTPRYAAEAAGLAWRRTMAFFNTHLKVG